MAHADFSGAWLGPQFVATCVLKPGWDMLEAPRLPHHETFVSFEHEYLLAYMQLADAKAAVHGDHFGSNRLHSRPLRVRLVCT